MRDRTRERLSRGLIAAGAVAMLLALPLAYLDRNVFEARGFADNAVEAVQDDAVRAKVAADVTRALVTRNPRLVAAAPLLNSATETVLGGAIAGSIIRRAAAETHKAIFSGDANSLVIDLANLGVVALGFVRTQDPELADRVATQGEIVVKLADRSLTVDLVDTASRVAVLAIVLPLLALALLGAALAVSRLRRGAALQIGLALVSVGAVSFVAFLILRAVVLAGHTGGARDVAAGIFGAFLGSYPWWCLAVGAAGAIVAASAATLQRRGDPADLPRTAWRLLTAEPATPIRAVLRAAALLLAGATIVGDPPGALAVAAVAVGGWMVFTALVWLLRLLVGPEPGAADVPSFQALRRRFVPWVLASLALVGLTAAGVGFVVDGRAGEAPAEAASTGCNGAEALCARPLDTVVFPTSHNATATAQDGYLNANHGLSFARQLDLGVRGLQIDAYLGQRNDRGVVRTDLAPKAVAQAEAKVGPEGLAAAQRLAGSVVFGPVTGPKSLFFCHVLCELGATPGDELLGSLKDWLDRHPREVLMIVIEDAAPAAEIKAAFERAGLAALASDFQPAAGRPFPTLGEMIASGKRLFVMGEDRGEATGWYHRAFVVMQETPFAFRSPAELQTDASCRPNRGLPSSPLFQVNSWVEAYPPNPRDADVVNQPQFLIERARRCERLRTLVPNLLAVDFVERGDVVGAAATLNGVPAAP